MWSDEHAVALGAVFEQLNSSDIEWMVLRNYSDLPKNNYAKDVDIGVDCKKIEDAINLISTTLERYGFERSMSSSFMNMRCTTYFKVNQSNVISLKIDLMDGFSWRGADVFQFKKIYSRRVLYGDFFVPSSADDAVMLWLKPIMIGAGVKEQYVNDIEEILQNDFNGVVRGLKEVVGDKLSDELLTLANSNRIRDTSSLKLRISLVVWTRSFLNKPIITVMGAFRHLFKELHRRSSRNRGSWFAVVGPDGVGKTTFIDILKNSIATIYVKDVRSVEVHHFRPHVIPNIKVLFSKKNYDVSKEEFSKPHRADSVNVISSFLRLCYYWMDYLIGYAFFIRRKTCNESVYIFDRYFYDFIVDPKRSRIGLPLWVRQLFLRLTPQPDLVFFLDCDSAIVYSRKKELSIDEISRQLVEYGNLQESFPNKFVVLDSLKPPAITCDSAMREIVLRCFDRTSA